MFAEPTDPTDPARPGPARPGPMIVSEKRPEMSL